MAGLVNVDFTLFGTLVGWPNAYRLMLTASFARAISSLNSHVERLIVFGEGEEFDD